MSALRSQDEIQRAHDMLIAVVTNEVDISITENGKAFLRAQCDVLCWILAHDHNTAFANNLRLLREDLDLHGIVEQRVEAV